MSLAPGLHFTSDDYDGPALPSAVALDRSEWGATRGEIAGARSPLRLMRPYFKGNPDPAELAARARHYGALGWRVVIGNELNLPHERFEGGPAAYRRLFALVRAQAPGVRLYWQAPSPNVPGWMSWYDGAEAADGLTVHAYGSFGPDEEEAMRSVVWAVRQRFPHMPLWVKECNPGPGPGRYFDRDEWARTTLPRFLDWCDAQGVEAVSYFAWRWQADTPIGTPVDATPAIVEALATWRPKAAPVPPQEPSMYWTQQLKTLLAAEFGAEFFDIRADLPTNPSVPAVGFIAPSTNGIAVHHTATTAAQSWLDVARYHIGPDASRNKVAWRNIAYNVGISDSGVFLLRDVEAGGNHVWGLNASLFGVALLGTFLGAPPPAAYLARLRRVIAVFDRMLGRELPVKGHTDWALPGGETSCPGPFVRDWARAFTRTAPPAPTTPPLPDALKAAARAAVVLPVNPDAALMRAIYADGFIPNGVEVQGDGMIAQSAEKLGERPRVYYTRLGEWKVWSVAA